MSEPLPEFERPPLDEVAIGVQFEPLKGFSAAHMGMFWSKLRNRYPYIEDNPPLPHTLELPEAKPLEGQAFVRVPPLALRCWLVNEDRTQLIQVQRDQFIRNWRRVDGTETYPRFPALLGAFRRDWQEFVAFTMDEKLGQIKIDQCELTYVNQIPKGEGWESFSEIDRVFSVLRPISPSALLDSPEVISWSGHYKLPKGQGRLYAEVSPGFRGRDFKFVLTLGLRARGAPEGESEARLLEWFDMAHEWTVRGFSELTDPKMHDYWGRQP